jgi:hypothetical protein
MPPTELAERFRREAGAWRVVQPDLLAFSADRFELLAGETRGRLRRSWLFLSGCTFGSGTAGDACGVGQGAAAVAAAASGGQGSFEPFGDVGPAVGSPVAGLVGGLAGMLNAAAHASSRGGWSSGRRSDGLFPSLTA